MEYADIKWCDNHPNSTVFDDIYYSSAGERDESEHVFLKNNNLPERFQDGGKFIIAETGFGFGLNFVLTMQAFLNNANDNGFLHYIGIEKYPVSPDDIQRLSKNWPDLAVYFDELLAVYPVPVTGHHTRTLFDGRVYLHFIFMDVIDALKHDQFNADIWYLDGFSPQKNPGLWSEQVFNLIAQNSKNDATLSTYTSAGSVRRGLITAGFDVNKVKGHGNKREMITAVLKNKQTYQVKSPWFDVPFHVAKNKSALVIGAGLAGLSVARSLLQRGWAVTIIDKHKGVAQEASGNPAGLVLPRLSIDNKTDSMFYTNAFLHAVSYLDELQSLSKEKFWFKSGVYSLMEHGKAEKIINRNGFTNKFISLLSCENSPQILTKYSGDMTYLPEAGWVIPHKICKAIDQVTGQGINRLSAEVNDLVRGEGCWLAKDRHGDVIASANVAIIANGTDVNALNVTSWLPVFPARGQMTKIPVSKESRKLEIAISFDGYVTPGHDGVHYTGATYDPEDSNKHLSLQDQCENIDRLNNCIPDVFLKPDKLEGRVGFRTSSEDWVPIVGAVPDRNAFMHMYSDLHHGRPAQQYENGKYLPGLYISAAHGSRGLCSCFLSAEIIASMAERDLLPISKSVCDYINPARFIIRQLKRSRPTG